jgi:hypothetical protein
MLLLGKLHAIDETATTEQRDLTDEEQKEFSSIESQIKRHDSLSASSYDERGDAYVNRLPTQATEDIDPATGLAKKEAWNGTSPSPFLTR